MSSERCVPLLFALSCSAALACGAMGGPDAAIDAFVEPSLEIGTGVESFVELSDTGAELELVHGPQGGWHVYLSARLRGLVPVSIIWEVRRTGDGEMLAILPLAVREGTFVPRGDAAERVGDLVILDILMPADVVGREVRVDASVRDAELRVVADTITATVIDLEP